MWCKPIHSYGKFDRQLRGKNVAVVEECVGVNERQRIDCVPRLASPRLSSPLLSSPLLSVSPRDEISRSGMRARTTRTQIHTSVVPIKSRVPGLDDALRNASRLDAGIRRNFLELCSFFKFPRISKERREFCVASSCVATYVHCNFSAKKTKKELYITVYYSFHYPLLSTSSFVQSLAKILTRINDTIKLARHKSRDLFFRDLLCGEESKKNVVALYDRSTGIYQGPWPMSHDR